MSLRGFDQEHQLHLQQLEGQVERYAAFAATVSSNYASTINGRVEAFLKAMPELSQAQLRAEAGKLLREVEAIGTRFFGPGSIFEARTVRELARAKRMGFELSRSQVMQMERRFAVELADEARLLIASAKDTFQLLSRNLVEEAVGTVRRLVTEELAMGQGAEVLKGKLIESGVIPDLDTGKRVIKAETRAAMIAQTELARAANGAYMESNRGVEPVEANRIYRWVAVHTATTAEDSLRRDGLVMTEEQWRTRDFGDGYYGLPPLRPNDRCSPIFYRRSWLDRATLAQIDGAEEYRLSA